MARKPVCDDRRRARGPHAPSAIAGRRITSRHHTGWCRLASVNFITTSGFRRPATRYRWHYQSCLKFLEMPRGWGQRRQNQRPFSHCRISNHARRSRPRNVLAILKYIAQPIGLETTSQGKYDSFAGRVRRRGGKTYGPATRGCSAAACDND